MRNQPASSYDSSTSLPPHITAVQSVHVWIDLMKSADKLLMAGLANQVGVELAKDAHRRWYKENSDRRQHIARLARRLRDNGG